MVATLSAGVTRTQSSSNLNVRAGLQTDGRRRVAPEEVRFPAVSGQHRRRRVLGLAHNDEVRCASSGRRAGLATAAAVVNIMRTTAAHAIIERLAEENRRVLSDWRAVILLRRATVAISSDQRRWDEAPHTLQAIHPVLRQMVARGQLRPITGQRHLYEVIVPYASSRPVEEYEILMEAHPYAALSHLSALAFHALTETLPKQLTVVIPSDGQGQLLPPGTYPEEWAEVALVKGRRTPTILGRPVEWIRLTPDRYLGTDLYRPTGYPIRVTTPERTLLDGLLQPERCGGLDGVLRAWALARDILNLDRLVQYVERLNIAVLRQRVGLLLDELKLSHPAVAAWPAQAKRGGSSKLLGSAPYAPTYSERWNLSINAPLTALHENAA